MDADGRPSTFITPVMASRLHQPGRAQSSPQPLLGNLQCSGHGREVVSESFPRFRQLLGAQVGGCFHVDAAVHQVVDRGPGDAEEESGYVGR